MSTYTASRLVSLNVGMPKPLHHRGKTVPSGIFKTPACGSLRIDWTELEGDAQADLVAHGESGSTAHPTGSRCWRPTA